MSKSGICQNGYPKILYLQNDTVVAITTNQVRQINVVKVELDGCKILTDSLMSNVDLSDKALNESLAIIDTCKQGLQTCRSSTDVLINDILTQKDKVKRLKRQRNIFAGSSLVFLLIIFL